MNESNSGPEPSIPAAQTDGRGGALGTRFGDACYQGLMEVNNDLANLQRELARANAELSRLNQEKNRFLGMAAHDLRSPLGIILNYSEFLRDEAVDRLTPEERDYVTVIQETSAFMLRLVENFLDISAIESGQLRLDRQVFDLRVLARANLRQNGVFAAKREIRLCLDAPEQPVQVHADEGKVQQVLNNLLSNAIKFSPTGSTVTVQLLSKPGAARLTVRDAGPGIPEDHLARLFKPFTSLSATAPSGERNTGLGLAICARIVEQHGGRIWAESVVGQGSTFCCELPAVMDR